MDRYVYNAEEVSIVIGIPIAIDGLVDTSLILEDYYSITIQPEISFSVNTGIFNDPIVKAKRGLGASYQFDIAIGSKENENLFLIFTAQTMGILGFPLTVSQVKIGDDDRYRFAHVSPVAVMEGLPKKVFGEKGESLRYTFQSPYMVTSLI